MASPQIVEILTILMSPNNSTRQDAEKYYSTLLDNNLQETVTSLIQELSKKEQDLILRSFCAILLRRVLDRGGSYAERLGRDFTSQIRSYLLQIWSTEANPQLLRRVSHVIAQCAAGGQWVDLIPLILSQTDTLSEIGKVSSLRLIETVAEYCPDDILTHIKSLCAFLSIQICVASSEIKSACARATAACISCCDDENARTAFKPALQYIINILGDMLTRGEEQDAVVLMEYLVDIAETQPLFFKGVLDNVVTAMLTVASSQSLEFSTRSTALELMVTLTETAPALARRCPALVQGIVPLAMSVMLEVEDEDHEWAKGEYSEESLAVEDNSVVGEEAIERVSGGMGGRIVAPLVLSAVEAAAQNPLWKYRRAAVAALTRLAEGSTEVFRQHLEISFQFLTATLNDISPLVQYQAIQGVGRLAHLYPDMLETMIPTFLPMLTTLLMANQGVCDRVRGHAASALINLTNPEHCPSEILGPYVDPLLSALCSCLQSAPLGVQSPCISLLGCVAQVASDNFAPYYPSFMPGIKQILHSATGPQHVELRGRAMEAAGLLGEAVGEELFTSDGIEIMQLLILLVNETENVFEYVLPACARIAKVLGKQFEPFLPLVISPVLIGATQEIKFSMENADEGEEEGEVTNDEETGSQTAVISLGGGVRKRITLNTHAVQQKNQCARILYELASSLKGNLYTYLNSSLQAILPLITDKHSSDIRASASLSLSKIFYAYYDAAVIGHTTLQEVQQVLILSLEKLLLSLAGEVNSTCRACAAEAVRDILVVCYESGSVDVDGCYSQPKVTLDLNTSIEVAKQLLQRCSEGLGRRQEKINAIVSNEGLDDEDKDGCAVELEEEDDILTNYADALGYLLKLNGEQFMPTFVALVVPALSPFLMPHQPESLQVLAVCIVDDMIEFGGTSAHEFIPQSLATFLRNLASSHCILRQSSSYGIAQILKKAPELIGSHLGATIKLLLALINSPNARDEENEGTTENAVFALGWICSNPQFRGLKEWIENDPSALVSTWLKNLPLRADIQEAKTTSRLLCDAVESWDPQIIGGTNQSNLADIFRIFADIIGAAPKVNDDDLMSPLDPSRNPLAHPTVHNHLEKLVSQMLLNTPYEVVTSVLSHLTLDQKNVLLKFKK